MAARNYQGGEKKRDKEEKKYHFGYFQPLQGKTELKKKK